jgi:hypothetical protein
VALSYGVRRVGNWLDGIARSQQEPSEQG